jgi:hypothetical protein
VFAVDGGEVSFRAQKATPALLGTLLTLVTTDPSAIISLEANLDNAEKNTGGNARRALLTTFIAKVESLSGTAFSPEAAAALISIATAIRG